MPSMIAFEAANSRVPLKNYQKNVQRPVIGGLHQKIQITKNKKGDIQTQNNSKQDFQNNIPIILFGRSYQEKVINLQFLCDLSLIGENDLSIYQHADMAKEAQEIIQSL